MGRLCRNQVYAYHTTVRLRAFYGYLDVWLLSKVGVVAVICKVYEFYLRPAAWSITL